MNQGNKEDVYEATTFYCLVYLYVLLNNRVQGGFRVRVQEGITKYNSLSKEKHEAYRTKRKLTIKCKNILLCKQ